MHRSALLALLDRHQARFSDDRDRVETIRRFVEAHADCFERSCREGHVTGSAWIASADGEQALLVRHRKLGAWLQPGGHADGDPDPAAVAWREAVEESGLESLRLVDWWRDGDASPLPFDVDVHVIPARGDEPAHLHLDIRFLLVANPEEPPRASDESDEARWIARERIAALNAEASLLRMAERAALLLRGGCYIAGSGRPPFQQSR
jgi:ADP-ribose pyrophosphatase YjhB (NUDIX family)